MVLPDRGTAGLAGAGRVKLATLRDGSRDGQLMVVARDLKTAQLADGIAPTMQAALDDWAFIAPQLEALSVLLDSGRAARSFDFDPARCLAPLPPWYISGSSQNVAGNSAPRARRTSSTWLT